MTWLKDELRKKIGDTSPQKARVWQRLQQPKRKKNGLPLLIALLFTGIVLFALLNGLPERNISIEDTPPEQTGAAEQPTSEFTWAIVDSSLVEPTEWTMPYTIYVAQDEAQYAQYQRIFEAAANSIDFTKQTVIFARYPSDGCGLVVEQLDVVDDMLQLTLLLPEELRNQSEVACTLISQWHTKMIIADKLDVQAASFIVNGSLVETSYNTHDVVQYVEPVMFGYVVKEHETGVLVTEATSVHFERIEEPVIEQRQMQQLPTELALQLGDFVTIYEDGTIDKQDDFTIANATSIVQKIVRNALLEPAVQSFQQPYVVQVYFDQVSTWQIDIIDGETGAHETFYYEE